MSDSDTQTATSLSSTRAKRTLKDKHGRKAAFEKLRELKGAKHKYDVGSVDKVYEEVEEKEYIKRRQDRMENDWIVDDDGSGYVEDGREIFDEEDDSLFTSNKKKGNHRKLLNNSKKPQEDNSAVGSIKRMFANNPIKKRKVEPQEMTEAQRNILEECLNEQPTKPVLERSTPIRSHERKPPLQFHPSPKVKYQKDDSLLRKRPREFLPNNQPFKPISRDLGTEESSMKEEEVSSVPSPTAIEPMESENLNGEGDWGADSDFLHEVCEEAKVTSGGEEQVKPSDEKSYCETKSIIHVWESTNSLPENTVPVTEVYVDKSKLPLTTNSEGEKVLRFYWLDAFEDYFAHPGVVYLFGKVYIESAQTHVSCCVTVKNIDRRVFLLPRERILNLKTKEEGNEVTMTDIYNEFNGVIAKKFNINHFKMKKVTKNYCFEKSHVPSEAEFLEIRYSAESPALPSILEGETFSCLFGANTSSLELLLLESKIKGPCWLDIKLPQPSPQISWCKVEVVAAKPVHVTPVVSGPSPPPLVVASLSFRTAINSKTLLAEIVFISCLIHEQFYMDKPPPSPLFQNHWCAVSKPTDVVWPWDLKKKVETYKGTKVEKHESERSLIGFFLTKLFRIDPDVLIGHDIFGFDLSILLFRIQANKVPHWSRIGRLKRTQMPKLSNKGFAERQAVCGRMVCDIKLSAQELIRAKSYDLEALVKQVLRVKDDYVTFSDQEIKKTFWSSDGILQLVNATMQDAFYCLKIATELNVLPLALQITNIAGNVMSRTLLGGRSERNEFLLLHAFTEKNFICPDKQYRKSKNDDKEEETQGKGKNGKKKVSYTGGLVLEPKRGFYDKYILLMDFNSLYPSIIQEYNICFTTVSRIKESSEEGIEDNLPDIPEADSKPGILPTEIRKLVESRREVKKLMKQSDLSPELKQQYDIRQKALKLTANSMYGCLGFSNSRFFARHLAALITGKGREILLNTKELVQRLNFEVIYGDTDSIMINTNSSDFEEVFKLGHKIKLEVNKRYKLLELDVDGVFKYMLLLKKKKYAAVTMTKLSNGEVVTGREIKGIDIVRRDWSQVAADAGIYILDQILSDQSPDERLENIHSHLELVKKQLEEGKVDLAHLAITKQLTKDPTDYPDKNSVPHVQVALRMNSKGGKKLRQGDTVAYVICQDGSSLNAPQRAYHLEEVKANNELKFDMNYYLAHQVHPVVSRLCDPMEGTDSARIAECLGLDPSGYRSAQAVDGEREEEIVEAEVSDEEKYKLSERFSFKCPSLDCPMIITVDAPTRGAGSSAEFLLQSCPDPKCKTSLYKHHAYILNKLRKQIRVHITLYYSGWMMCDDPACSNRTRRIPLKFIHGFPRCNQCQRGVLFREYTETQLYKQLCFYDYIFDYQKGCLKNKELRNKNEDLKKTYFHLQNEVKRFLKMNFYSVIDLGSIFSSLCFKRTGQGA